MNPNPDDKRNYLEGLAMLEEKIRDIYLLFAERFAADSPAANFWRVIAAEENEHAATIRSIDPVAAGAGLEKIVASDHFHLDVTRDQLSRIDSHIRENRISLEAAISLAYGIEYSLAEKHAFVTTTDREESFLSVLSRLHIADKAHLDKLRAFGAERKVFLPADH